MAATRITNCDHPQNSCDHDHAAKLPVDLSKNLLWLCDTCYTYVHHIWDRDPSHSCKWNFPVNFVTHQTHHRFWGVTRHTLDLPVYCWRSQNEREGFFLKRVLVNTKKWKNNHGQSNYITDKYRNNSQLVCIVASANISSLALSLLFFLGGSFMVTTLLLK